MSDVFIEYLVVKRAKAKDILLKIGIVAAAVIVAFLALVLLLPFGLGSIGFVLAVGAVYGAYFLVTSFNVEFEYILTNGEMDVDKIIAQRRRKRLITVKCKNFEAFGKYDPAKHQTQNYKTRIIACDDETGDNVWYCTVRHNTLGHTLLVFNASEKMLEGMRPFLPRLLLKELNQGKVQVVQMNQDAQEEQGGDGTHGDDRD